MSKQIKLSQGRFTIIDDSDYEEVCKFNWYFLNTGTGYAAASAGNKKIILLHRFITKAPKGMDVDHINHDGLDNRRSNLRVCNHSENMANSRMNSSNISGRKGVCWDNKRGKWYAYIGHKNKDIGLGMFDEFSDAVKAREDAEIQFFGNFRGVTQ